MEKRKIAIANARGDERQRFLKNCAKRKEPVNSLPFALEARAGLKTIVLTN